jgi:uncharacterized protein DUF4258
MSTGIAPLSRREAAERIRQCIRLARIRFSRHFKEELAKEGLSVPDAHYVLYHGQVYMEPEHDVYFQQWRYRMEGTEPDGRYLSIIFTFEGPEDGLLVTIFSNQN